MAGHIYGCHACGVKHPPEAGLWVADHQPPNNDAKRKANEPFRQAVSKLSFGRFGGRPPQQFYPHCKECSTWQVRDHCMLSWAGRRSLPHPNGVIPGADWTSCGTNEQGTAVRLDRRHMVNHLTDVFTRTKTDSRQAGFSISGMMLRVRPWHFAGVLLCVASAASTATRANQAVCCAEGWRHLRYTRWPAVLRQPTAHSGG